MNYHEPVVTTARAGDRGGWKVSRVYVDGQDTDCLVGSGSGSRGCWYVIYCASDPQETFRFRGMRRSDAIADVVGEWVSGRLTP